MDRILIIAIVISVLTVVNICLYVVTITARNNCKEYVNLCRRTFDDCLNTRNRNEITEVNCARYAGEMEGFLKGRGIEEDDEV